MTATFGLPGSDDPGIHWDGNALQDVARIDLDEDALDYPGAARRGEQ